MWMMTKVVNIRKEEYDVYIGRPSLWGNPFVIGKDGSREEVVKKYETYIRSRLEKEPNLKSELLKLGGKKLGCYCAPQACHGDVLLKIIDEIKNYEN